jgi:NADH-quinone oxidoreductase subunit F
MPLVQRVLDSAEVSSLAGYVEAGGGDGLDAARKLEPTAAIEQLLAAGIRGRGGAGFPTGIKWRTVAENASPLEPSTVVVNAAEGEPGSFKDRELLRRNPYRVLEGSLIAAHAVGADRVVVGMKRTFSREAARVRAAIEELEQAGWPDGITLTVVEGPGEYLLGEETGLLEVIDGRPPFPRIAPPYRRGVDEVVEHADDLGTGSGLSAHVEMAAPGDESWAPPTLVDNVETLAHVTLAFAHGVDWFRSVGTEQSPGTVVCTVSGDTQRAGVGEVPMGTPLREVIELLGGGPRPGTNIGLVLQGVASAVVPADLLDTPVSWEGMARIGSGLGAAAFIVCADTTDPVAIAAGVARFLAIESCGQCTPCKQDGLALWSALDRLRQSDATEGDVDAARARLATIADGARCSLASQQQAVVGSLLDRYAAAFDAHADATTRAVERADIVPMLDLQDGEPVLDLDHARKQPDWTFDAEYSGQAPADRLDDHRRPGAL